MDTFLDNSENIKTENDVLTSDLYKNSKTVLVYATNGSAYLPFGVAEGMGNKYPYGCIHARRRRLFNLNRVVRQDRAETGTVFFTTPPRIENEDLPYVACIIAQYGVWKEIESNDIARDIAKKTTDIDHARRLNEDTGYHRKIGFTKALTTLYEHICNRSDIVNVILPAGLGMGSYTGLEWRRDYLPSILTLARRLKQHNISVVLLTSGLATAEEVRRKLNMSPVNDDCKSELTRCDTKPYDWRSSPTLDEPCTAYQDY